MSTIAVNAVTDANGGNTATINSMTPTADSLQGFRNRIINGDMRIDQRNAGAAVTINTTSNTYTLDRWTGVGQNTDGVFTVDQVTEAPAGFTNSAKITVTTADASIGATQSYLLSQFIEGNNIADLGWGAAGAKTITVSFWVRSSLTGTFGGALNNSANDRGYPFTYSISAANTWEYKTITIAGDTSGTWLTDTGRGIALRFQIGAGSDRISTAGSWTGTSQIYGATGATNIISTVNADWYITGVQLEVGSVPSSFERRPYGTELALCQRYYYKIIGSDISRFGLGYVVDGTRAYIMTTFPTTMRTSPTAVEQTGTAANYGVLTGVTSTACSSVPTFNVASEWLAFTQFTVASGLTAGQSISGRPLTSSVYLGWSAEL